MSYEDYGPYIAPLMLVTFLALFAWVLHPKNKKGYDDAANLPFSDNEDEELGQSDGTDNGRKEK